MKTVIVSDIHLGAPNSRAKEFLKFLDIPKDLLIINGDLVDSLDLCKFDHDDWKVIKALQGLARCDKLRFIVGNHDYESEHSFETVGQLLGTNSFVRYPILVGDKQYLITHGDIFDRSLKYKRISHLADWAYYQMQRVGLSGAKIKRKVREMAGVFTGVKTAAVDYALTMKYDGIILGHTHQYDDIMLDNVHYVNSGCWTESLCSYVVIDGSDAIKLRHWRS